MKTKRARKMIMVVAFDGAYEQGDRYRPHKMEALGRALEDGLEKAGRSAGVVHLYCLPFKDRTKPRPRGR
jgi:hypothetical protein